MQGLDEVPTRLRAELDAYRPLQAAFWKFAAAIDGRLGRDDSPCPGATVGHVRGVHWSGASEEDYFEVFVMGRCIRVGLFVSRPKNAPVIGMVRMTARALERDDVTSRPVFAFDASGITNERHPEDGSPVKMIYDNSALYLLWRGIERMLLSSDGSGGDT